MTLGAPGSLAVESAPTVRCGDYSAHQLWHLKGDDGTWRCEVCQLDSDRAEPVAEQVAFDWALKEPEPTEQPARTSTSARPRPPSLPAAPATPTGGPDD